jgi:hypothetical protein
MILLAVGGSRNEFPTSFRPQHGHAGDPSARQSDGVLGMGDECLMADSLIGNEGLSVCARKEEKSGVPGEP